MFPEVVLQEGQAESPLGSTHCLHRPRVSLSHCTLQPLIQLAYLLQPGLWEEKYRLGISPAAITAQHFMSWASTLGLTVWRQFVNVFSYQISYGMKLG